MNMVCLLGRLTADPELRHTQSQVPVTSFTLAVDRAYQPKGQERQADFINIVAWRQTAEFVSRYFHKGSMIVVSGRLQSRKWQDREGNNRTNWEVNADNVYFGESRRDSDSGSTVNYQPSYSDAGRSRAPMTSSGFSELDDDGELPF